MRERSTPQTARDARSERPLGEAYRLGPLIRADREARVHGLVSVASDSPSGVAKIARRERRAALASALRAEGELLCKVRHPNVAQGYEVGESDDLGAFLIRERIEGVDLGTHLRSVGALSSERLREITGALVSALRALEAGGVAVSIDPTAVWIEDGTERVVLESASPSPNAADAQRQSGPNAIADVLIACTRGRLPTEERTRARARVEVLQARRSGAPLADIPEDLGDIIEICAVRRPDGAPAPWDEIQARLEGAPGPGGDSTESRGADRRGRASEIEGLLRASIDLNMRREDLPLPSNLPRLLEQAGRGAPKRASEELRELEATLSSVADDLGRVLAKVVEDRAAALESEWCGFERVAGPFLTEPDAEVPGLTELDDVRRTAGRLQRGENGPNVRRELARALEHLERATHGVWADALTKLRDVVDRSAWGSLATALGELREQMIRTARLEASGSVSFRPSPELAEVLRILAEAERDSPPASDSEAVRLQELRTRGEILLAGLDAKQARNAAPELVDRLVEHCAAAAEAERRGEHARAIEELEAANASWRVED